MLNKHSFCSEYAKNVCSIPLAWTKDFLEMKNQMLKMKEFLIKTECNRSQFCEETNLELYLKKDCHQITGSCHARSALCSLLSLSMEEAKFGMVTASEEEAFPLCYFGSKLNIPVTVVFSKMTPPYKIEACKQFQCINTIVLIQGDDPNEAEIYAFKFAKSNNMHYRNDRARFIGYGSVGIEICEQVPNLDVVVVPFDRNDKTLAQSILLVMSVLKPSVQVVLAACTTARSKSSSKIFQSIQADSLLSVPSSKSNRALSLPKNSIHLSPSIQTSPFPTVASFLKSEQEIRQLRSRNLLESQLTELHWSISPIKSIPSATSVQKTQSKKFSIKPFTSPLSSLISPKKPYFTPVVHAQKDYVNFKYIWFFVNDNLIHIAFEKLFEKEHCLVDKLSAVSFAACFFLKQTEFEKKRVVSLLINSNKDILTLPKYLEHGLFNQSYLMLMSGKIPSTPRSITNFCEFLMTSKIAIKKFQCQREKAAAKQFNIKIFCETRIVNEKQFQNFLKTVKLEYPNIKINKVTSYIPDI